MFRSWYMADLAMNTAEAAQMTNPTFELRRLFFTDGIDMLRAVVLVNLSEDGSEDATGITVEATMESVRDLTIAQIADRAFELAKQAMAIAIDR